MKQTQAINFYCRKSKVDKKGEAFILISIIINGKREFIQLQRKCKPEDFEKAMSSKKSNPIQQYCLSVRAKLDELIEEMMMSRIELTAENLKECFKRGFVLETYTIKDLFDNYLLMIKARVPETMSQDTYNRYVKASKFFFEFNPQISETTPANSVEYTNLCAVQSGLAKKYDTATSCNYLQKLKAMFKSAFEDGKIHHNPASRLKVDKGVKDTILYLTQEEVDRLRKKQYIPRLERVRDLFLFQCFTGLAWSDIEQLTTEDFQTREETGQIYIEKQRQKTGVTFVAVLLKDAKEIAKKYSFQLPTMSNQKMNAYLKEVGDLAGLDKQLTTHMARHTACAFLLNHRNPTIPNETIIKIMGWTNEKQLRHYARLLKETLMDDVKTISDRPARPKDDEYGVLRINKYNEIKK